MIQINNLKMQDTKIENDFDNPLGLLSDCHRRIEKFLEQLLLVTKTARGGVLNDEQTEALQTALRYFKKAAPMHTADEETSLFPRLRELASSGNDKAQQALKVMERLEADHDAADEKHAIIDDLGVRWLEASTLSEDDTATLERELTDLRAFYAAHIAVEDNELFPLADGVLAENSVESLGREMASRRGLDFDKLPAGGRCAARRAAAEADAGKATSFDNQTIGQLVAEHPGRAQVFEKAGIDYCCGGKLLLGVACSDAGLDLQQVKQAIIDFDAANVSSGTDWTRASMTELADHIITTHHDYLREALPRLSQLTARVKNAHGARHPALIELDAVFSQMRAGLEEHTMKEERVLFPSIKQLDSGQMPSACTVSRAVVVMEAEHDEAGGGLKKIRELTKDFELPTDTCNTHRALVFSLKELEEDLHHHIHKENSILFPRAVQREKELLVPAN